VNVKNYKTISRFAKQDSYSIASKIQRAEEGAKCKSLIMYRPLMVSFYSNSSKEVDN